ncbi:regulator of G-protein signaling 14 isoform X2 [Bombina bombina]|uniref:regulator of G-protein signaling 14 isoform X2 n=1 Tax=Bombina bombina TaxID=8345 RepID=UPI00235AFD8A|nr:regulator of G-protein signaling 14 isoform X2 [Bombina bombina]
MLGKMKYLDVPNGRMVLAVSDGELNHAELDGRGSGQSLNSLPSVQSDRLGTERSVGSWAVSFERLLQDPLGVEYFTDFLKKEYSAENIFFWQACEKFQSIPADDTEQLSKESRRIYKEFLSSSSLCPVNVDHQAIITEDMLEKPTPDLFRTQQLQIFNLMKFDSYARFVKSPLYQECMVAEVEGRSLPHLSSADSTGHCTNHTTGAIKKKTLRSGKSLPVGVEVAGMDNTEHSSKHHRLSFKKKDKKGHGKDNVDDHSSRRESQTSLNSATSLDLSFASTVSSKSENDGVSHSSMGLDIEPKPMKYCCVYFPDGTASLTLIRPGLTIRDMLSGVCEKRGYCTTDVKVYLTGNEQKALALDQDCVVLADQEVRLENRVGFDLQIEPLHKNIHLVAKSNKTLGEALDVVLKKYHLDIHHLTLTKIGESQAVDQRISVNEVAGQKLILETVNELNNERLDGGNHAKHQTKKESAKEKSGTQHNPVHYERAQRDELVELLNRVQSSRADDQRGLLTKEVLVLPDFLRLPADDECGNCHGCSLNFSTDVLKTSLAHVDMGQPSTNCNENKTTNISSPTENTFCSTDSQTQLTTNTTHEKTLSNLTSSHHHHHHHHHHHS